MTQEIIIYARVINGEILENNRTLPFSNETTSFGVGSTPADMLAHDYYPVVGTEPEYNRDTQRINGVTYPVVGNEVIKTYNVVDISLDELKGTKTQALKELFTTLVNSRPRVATGLGYEVDGGRDNKDDFFSKWETMGDADTTTVRDADNQFHPNTTKVQMQTIYRAIVANGELLLQWKWQKEIEIANCTTLTELDLVVF